jgi:hypothetical protein
MNGTIAQHNGWTFDPSREVWYAKTGDGTWTEVKGALDDPPGFAPAAATDSPVWVRMCGHPGCVITAPHAHGIKD